ncbi:MAG TPA: ATP-binding protein, partial [Pseudomonadales bacterium]|nr:ATP-binding protein [Pseudomonadales bacterium]
MDAETSKHLLTVLQQLQQYLPPLATPVDWGRVEAAQWIAQQAGGYLQAIRNTSGIRLQDLQGVDRQKQVLEQNIKQFLHGYPANHALLWGARGTGKSSIVRAMLNEYAADGLRLIQVEKADLKHLPVIAESIAGASFKFVIFCDDLSFDAHDDSYKALKSALEGSVFAVPENVLLIATSNRRHLLPEYQSDNTTTYITDSEIHYGEAVEEKISLSDRFGLWLSFYSIDQSHYL